MVTTVAPGVHRLGDGTVNFYVLAEGIVSCSRAMRS
jgi:hypothetical protein